MTTDKNLKYQQNLQGRELAIFVISTTNWNRIKPRAFELADSISKVGAGTYTEFNV